MELLTVNNSFKHWIWNYLEKTFIRKNLPIINVPVQKGNTNLECNRKIRKFLINLGSLSSFSSTILTRMRLGHTTCPSHMVRFHIVDSLQCDVDMTLQIWTIYSFPVRFMTVLPFIMTYITPCSLPHFHKDYSFFF